MEKYLIIVDLILQCDNNSRVVATVSFILFIAIKKNIILTISLIDKFSFLSYEKLTCEWLENEIEV